MPLGTLFMLLSNPNTSRRLATCAKQAVLHLALGNWCISSVDMLYTKSTSFNYRRKSDSPWGVVPKRTPILLLVFLPDGEVRPHSLEFRCNIVEKELMRRASIYWYQVSDFTITELSAVRYNGENRWRKNGDFCRAVRESGLWSLDPSEWPMRSLNVTLTRFAIYFMINKHYHTGLTTYISYSLFPHRSAESSSRRSSF